MADTHYEIVKSVKSTWLTRAPRSFAGVFIAWSILALFAASVAYWKDFHNAASWMPASYNSVFVQKNFYQLWTSLFAHADSGHLLSNSLTFFVMGYFLVGYFSLWFFPLFGIFIGGLINALVLQSLPPEVRLIGISGVVYWMGGAWLILYFMIDKGRTYFQRALRALGVALGVFFPAAAFDPSISYRAHLYGFLLGLICGGLYYFANRKKFLKALVIETKIEAAPLFEEHEGSR